MYIGVYIDKPNNMTVYYSVEAHFRQRKKNCYVWCPREGSKWEVKRISGGEKQREEKSSLESTLFLYHLSLFHVLWIICVFFIFFVYVNMKPTFVSKTTGSLFRLYYNWDLAKVYLQSSLFYFIYQEHWLIKKSMNDSQCQYFLNAYS